MKPIFALAALAVASLCCIDDGGFGESGGGGSVPVPDDDNTEPTTNDSIEQVSGASVEAESIDDSDNESGEPDEFGDDAA